MNRSTQQDLQRRELLMDEFRAGLTACLRSWSALRTATEQSWGGSDSLQKAEDLRMNILKHFDGSCFPPKSLTIDDLEDNLAIYLEEEFSVALEDNSERQVAADIYQMYENCHKGDPTLARKIVEAADQALSLASSYPIQVQTSEQDDDDDDDEKMELTDPSSVSQTSSQVAITTTPQPTMTAREYAGQYLFGEPRSAKKSFAPTSPVRQLGEALPTEQIANEQEMDEDGFTTVASKSSRKPKSAR